MALSIIIPTFKSPKYLDLCLESIIKGQYYEKNQIIVVVDGFYEINKDVIKKYYDYIEVLNLTENVGLCRGTNLGVYNAKYDKILIINDDNIAPKWFDKYLLEDYEPNSVLTPNQIEPNPSIFPQFHIYDLGKSPDKFDLYEFYTFASTISHNKKDNTGSTLPIFMDRLDYLKVGGWDENYPTNGMVADCDFFLKCRLSGMKMLRTYKCPFYHFPSTTVNGGEREREEIKGHEYFKYKYGSYMGRDKFNNIILI